MPNQNPQILLRSRIRAPLLWILLPLIIGYILARTTPEQLHYPKIFLTLGTLLASLWIYSWWMQLHKILPWKIIGLSSIFLLSSWNLLFHLPPQLDWTHLPEREVNVLLKITQTHSNENKYHRQMGYAKIIDTPKHLKNLKNQNLAFFLFPEKNSPQKQSLIRSQLIQAKGILTSIPENSTNSYDQYLLSQGIHFKLSRGLILKTEKLPNSFYQFCDQQNKRLETILSKNNPNTNDQLTPIYIAMLLGKQATLTPEQKHAFQITGSLHLFSISGLHVAMIGAFIAFLLKIIRIPNSLNALISLCILYLYVEITGGSPSAMRAFLMVVFYWGAKLFSRKKSAFSALLASALITLIANPFNLWNIGFQLSYGVVASILLYGVPLNEIINNWINEQFSKINELFKKSLKWCLNLTGISLAANIGSTFLSILYFQTFAPGAILLSIFIIPLASGVMIIGCISLITGIIGLTIISTILNSISCYIIKIMELTIIIFMKIPGLFLSSLIENNLLIKLLLILTFLILYLGHVFNKLKSKTFYSLPIAIISLFGTLCALF